MTYGEECDWYQCNPSQGLTCSSGYGTGCFCPNNNGGSVCDCLTTQYWSGSACTARVGPGTACTATYMYIHIILKHFLYLYLQYLNNKLFLL
jgi:hypothetical protein